VGLDRSERPELGGSFSSGLDEPESGCNGGGEPRLVGDLTVGGADWLPGRCVRALSWSAASARAMSELKKLPARG
jgi:hypothetical protein